MLINMRNGLMAGRGWKNPYVTDGLVAMWDGEWNAGREKHSSTVGMKNLAGDDEIVLPDDLSKWEMKDKSMHLKWGYDQSASTSFTIPRMTWLDSSQWTVEIVACRIRGYSDTIGGIGIQMNKVFELRYGQLNLGTVYMYDTSGNRSSSDMSVSNTTLPHTLSFRYNGTMANVFCDALSKVSKTISMKPFSTSSIRVGNIYSYVEGEIYSIRIYSRALAQDEISHNYLIDDARFKLPDAT